ncbi:sensor histidine kinase [Actinomadura terrae]|uniref:sensor histidine kinase n=1 Tax=Actinomadura terrae TaxID=604353 RepID=UPI001FA6F0D4|nr:sensor histidine kinase [Actinomadura terrae]
MRADGNVGRWPRAADWGVPLLLVCAQLAATWLLTEGTGEPFGRARWTAVTGAGVLAAITLLWRRIAPWPVLVTAVLLSAYGIVAAGGTDAPAGGMADGVALYSLAVARPGRQAVAGCLLAFTVAFAAYLPQSRGAGDLVTTEVLDAVYYLAIITFGQLRRQREAVRRRRLAGISREHRQAAAAERERLARDLHDVAGHHLSAVVVHSGAAARGGDPELVRGALAVAAETGREVLASLSRLVDVVSPQAEGGGLRELLPPLCQGLHRLGVPVSLAVEGRARKLPAEVTTAAYRIVQESLTNVMRYGSGGPVRVRVRYLAGAVEMAVENDLPAYSHAVPAFGTGRGIPGMRERASRIGGALDAGPTPAGGWAVTARLPTTTPSEHGAGWPEILDAVTIAFCAALPALGLVPPEPLASGWSGAGLVLVAAALAVRGVPLWWRRRAPYAALGVLTAVDAVLAVTSALEHVDPLALFLLGCPAQLVMVYSVACYGRDVRRTWHAAPLATLPWGLGLGTALAVDPEVAADGAAPLPLLFGLAAACLVTVPFMAAVWAWGAAVARRSRRWESTALDAASARTGEAVHAERTRVAAGLSGTVLERTARLTRAAEAGLAGGDGEARAALDVVAGQARAALTDMRGLLESLEEKA